MSDSDERTEAPTPRRREEARARGQVARSGEFTSAAALLAGVIALQVSGPALLRGVTDLMRQSLSGLHAVSEDHLAGRAASAGLAIATPLLPFLLAALVSALACGLLQTGFLFNLGPLAPRAERIAPDLGRLFSPGRTGAAFLKAAALLSVLGLTIWGERASVLAPANLLETLGRVVFTLALRGALVLMVLGVLDYAVRRWQFERSLRMTPADAREEMRRNEVDPDLRRRRRALHRRLSAPGALHRVPGAAVVVAGPGGSAVAVEYDPASMEAPRIAAKGTGRMGERILEAAHEHGVPVVETEAADALFRRMEVGAFLRSGEFGAVADALAFAFAARGRTV